MTRRAASAPAVAQEQEPSAQVLRQALSTPEGLEVLRAALREMGVVVPAAPVAEPEATEPEGPPPGWVRLRLVGDQPVLVPTARGNIMFSIGDDRVQDVPAAVAAELLDVASMLRRLDDGSTERSALFTLVAGVPASPVAKVAVKYRLEHGARFLPVFEGQHGALTVHQVASPDAPIVRVPADQVQELLEKRDPRQGGLAWELVAPA